MLHSGGTHTRYAPRSGQPHGRCPHAFLCWTPDRRSDPQRPVLAPQRNARAWMAVQRGWRLDHGTAQTRWQIASTCIGRCPDTSRLAEAHARRDEARTSGLLVASPQFPCKARCMSAVVNTEWTLAMTFVTRCNSRPWYPGQSKILTSFRAGRSNENHKLLFFLTYLPGMEFAQPQIGDGEQG